MSGDYSFKGIRAPFLPDLSVSNRSVTASWSATKPGRPGSAVTSAKAQVHAGRAKLGILPPMGDIFGPGGR
jgi:hypothetical protein